jgi:hypothetical protein
MAAGLDARALREEEVSRARAMDPAERLLEGPRLFDRACELMRAGIRHGHPGASEAEVLERLRHQLDLVSELEGRREQR